MMNVKIAALLAVMTTAVGGCTSGSLCSGTADCEAWLNAHPYQPSAAEMRDVYEMDHLTPQEIAKNEAADEATQRAQRAAFLRCDYEAHAATVGERGILMPAADYATLRSQCMQAMEAAQ